MIPTGWADTSKSTPLDDFRKLAASFRSEAFGDLLDRPSYVIYVSWSDLDSEWLNWQLPDDPGLRWMMSSRTHEEYRRREKERNDKKSDPVELNSVEPNGTIEVYEPGYQS